MAYGSYRKDFIGEGDICSSVLCKNCKKEIVIFDDKLNGTRLVGEGVEFDGDISATCTHCLNDVLYSPELVFGTQAVETQRSNYPEREPISKSSRKSINKAYPNAKVIMGVSYIEDRPRAAALLVKIVTSWADMDIQCARLLAELMGANISAAAAVFGSIRNSRGQHEALRTAAETVLSKKDLLLLNAYIKRKEALEKERNDLANGYFGVSISIPDHIVWVSKSNFLAFAAAHKANEKPFDLSSKQFVYELGTLERIAEEISELYTQIGFYTGYLVARHSGQEGEAFRAIRYPQLCEKDHIQKALNVLQKKRVKATVKPSNQLNPRFSF
jgi:hypothetical protein